MPDPFKFSFSGTVMGEEIRKLFADKLLSSSQGRERQASAAKELGLSRGSITSLDKKCVALQVDAVSVKKGALEVTVELMSINGQENPVAAISFGGSHSIHYPLPQEGYSKAYREIVTALERGNYSLFLNERGSLDISFSK